MKYAVIDLSTDISTAVAVPGVVKMIRVNTVLSAHVCNICDAADPVIRLPASLTAGTIEDYREGFEFKTNIVVDPDNAATGEIVIGYEEYIGRAKR